MTIFEKIIMGEIPSYKIYEDELTYAFLDIEPHSPGHTLVIPKTPYKDLSEIPEEALGPILKTVKLIALKSKEVLGADGYNIVMNNGAAAGQEVFHAHIHIIPRYVGDEPLHTKRPDLNLDENMFIEIQSKLSL